MSREVVEPWASAMVKAGLVDGRSGKRADMPSMRRLADAAGTTASTISEMMYGGRDTSNDVVERVARALDMAAQVDVVMSWVDRERTKVRPFEPHPDANLLTSEEQDAVNEVIRLLALPKKRGGGEHDRSAANQTAEPELPKQAGARVRARSSRQSPRAGTRTPPGGAAQT